ncbi:uncharacterized protein HKW66_Vig0121880 [Vigna angularis]|uniref:Uncharacterized protein n=1 Tax=Phaseolus angularis TaxID=3914 RepID=A0A8T0JWY1_PHAAN|nr:uncharacterized protein HKW66_Vig0121880 [Vigna angularis]
MKQHSNLACKQYVTQCWKTLTTKRASNFHRLSYFTHTVPALCRKSMVIAISIRTNHYLKGEASWNVTWDTQLARWLRRLDSACLLFGAFGSKYCSYY